MKKLLAKIKAWFTPKEKEPCVKCEYRPAGHYGYVYCIKCGHGAGP